MDFVYVLNSLYSRHSTDPAVHRCVPFRRPSTRGWWYWTGESGHVVSGPGQREENISVPTRPKEAHPVNDLDNISAIKLGGGQYIEHSLLLELQ